MPCRTSSQICGRWYLPTFLLRDGLFALMYRASLINLIRFWSSLPKMENRMVLTADKGVSMVVMDRDEYNRKSEELLEQPNYKIIQTDPTNKYRNKLISTLKTIKSEGGIDENTYKRLYPQQLHHLNIMGYLKSINQGCHSDP